MTTAMDRAAVLAVIERHTGRLGWRADRPAVREALELLGRPGSRWMVPTPAAVVSITDLVDNVVSMQARIDGAGLTVRPHTKTHKCAAVAELQLLAGAVGVCCAKLGEAEALARAGIGPIHVTSPIVPALARRMTALVGTAPGTTFVVDGVDGVRAATEVAASSGCEIEILVDIDVGLGRTGVRDAADAIDLAMRVAAAPGLVLAGVQGYGGHWQHVVGQEARAEQVRSGIDRLRAAIDAIEAAVGPLRLRTGGGTGTIAADCALGVLNDLQPGSYVFMDRQYRIALGDDEDGRFATALTIQASVVSANQPGWVTVDAGLKAFATDADPPSPIGVEGRYRFYGDEHGMLTTDPALRVGDRVEFLSPHCDPTVDRYDVLHVVDGDELIGVVPVDARGCST